MRRRPLASADRPPRRRPCARAGAVLLAATLAGCQAARDAGSFIAGGVAPPGFAGAVAADEPRAATLAREVLADGGNAFDAATALGFALAVTLPSRAGLGGGGACVTYSPDHDAPGGGAPQSVLFTAPPGPGGAGVPMLARGLFAVHEAGGKREMGTLIVPAERMARFGVPASRALAADLATVGDALLADPAARAVFGPDGPVLAEGDTLTQPDLAGTLARLRVAGIGDLYGGEMGRRFVRASAAAGRPVTIAALRAALPQVGPAATAALGRDRVGVTAGPGGEAVLAALAAGPGAAPAAPGGVHAASTSFAVADASGNAVACALSLNNLFGGGRVAPDTGVLLADQRHPGEQALLTAAIAWNAELDGFRAAIGTSGQSAAPGALATILARIGHHDAPATPPVPEPGRAELVACDRYLPAAPRSCTWSTDPRGAGLATGGEGAP